MAKESPAKSTLGSRFRTNTSFVLRLRRQIRERNGQENDQFSKKSPLQLKRGKGSGKAERQHPKLLRLFCPQLRAGLVHRANHDPPPPRTTSKKNFDCITSSWRGRAPDPPSNPGTRTRLASRPGSERLEGSTTSCPCGNERGPTGKLICSHEAYFDTAAAKDWVVLLLVNGN